MDDRLCNTSTMNRKNPKIFHIGSHFIKVPQTVALVTVNIAVWINSAGLGLDLHIADKVPARFSTVEAANCTFRWVGPIITDDGFMEKKNLREQELF